MNISVNVQLTSDDSWTQTSEEAANTVLAALGGDPTKDTCTINVQTMPVTVGSTPPVPTPGDLVQTD